MWQFIPLSSWCKALVKMSQCRVCYSLSHISGGENIIITKFEWQRSSTNPCSTSSAHPESAACPRTTLTVIHNSVCVSVLACVFILGYIYPFCSVGSAKCPPCMGSDFLAAVMLCLGGSLSLNMSVCVTVWMAEVKLR